MNDNLSSWLAKELERRGWSHRELARRAGVSQTAVSQAISGDRNIGWDFCAKIAGPLDMTPEEVLRLAGLLSKSSHNDDKLIRQLSDRFQELSAERRRRVLDFALFEYQQQKQDQEQKQSEQNNLGTNVLGNTT